MRKIATIFFLFMFSAGSYAQWVQQNSGTTNTLYTIFFASSDTGYAAGDGVILKTINGGSSWNTITSIPGDVIRGMYFINGTTGYATGDSGLIIKTTDGGLSWNNQISGTDYNINSVFFLDAANGFAVDDTGTMFKTIDGGNTWTSPSGFGIPLKSVYFSNANTGYAVGNWGTIVKTTIGGLSWSMLNSGATKNLKSVCFMNILEGIAVGDSGTILKTTNGGTTWSAISGAGNVNLKSIGYYPGFVDCYIVGDGGFVFYYRAVYGWSPETTCTTEGLNSLCFSPNNRIYAAGNNGTIIKKNYCVPDWYKYAYTDSVQAYMNTPVVVHVLANDSLNPPTNAYNYIANPVACDYPYPYGVLQSEHGGSLNIMNNDSILYTPSQNFTGWDNFYYAICDSGVAYEEDTTRVNVYVVPTAFLNLDQINGGINDTLFVSSYPATLDAGFGWQTYYWSNGGTAQTTQVSSNGWYSATVSLPTKLVSSDSIYVLMTTYGQLTEEEKSIVVYPNPAGEEIFIQTPCTAELEIFDIQGRIIFAKTLNERNNSTDVSDLKKGVYMLKIRTEGNIVIRKMAKK